MIRDLEAGGGDIRDADVLVIGAGIAGLLIATRLSEKGLRVVVLESGGEHQDDETHPLNAVEHLAQTYAGAAHGRFRCLGGTSTRWGGAMIPMLRADLDADPDSAWPIGHDALMRHAPEVETLFGLPAGAYDMPELVTGAPGAAPMFVPRLAKWPPFRSRNVAVLLNDRIRAENGPEIWLNATATRFTFAADGRLDTLTAEAANGNAITVRARQVVVAAGAIESTRLLLLADRQADDRIFAPYDVLGRYFHDHLSVEVAEIVPRDKRRMNRTLGFRFERGGMRNVRFEPAETEAARATLTPGFAHVNFESPQGGGFDTVREVYRRLQQRRLPEPALAGRLALGAPWLARAAWWRFFEHRLLYPDGAKILLHMVVEQAPRPENRISLSATARDPFGQPLATIDWRVGAQDQARLTHATDLFLDYWAQGSLAALGTVQRFPAGVAEARLAEGGGIYHPGGSTRMGTMPQQGVVDGDLRCFGIPNLSVAATSVFPTGGGANPTMMLMLASFRLADRLAHER